MVKQGTGTGVSCKLTRFKSACIVILHTLPQVWLLPRVRKWEIQTDRLKNSILKTRRGWQSNPDCPSQTLVVSRVSVCLWCVGCEPAAESRALMEGSCCGADNTKSGYRVECKSKWAVVYSIAVALLCVGLYSCSKSVICRCERTLTCFSRQ
jgi:hypothetical protein